MKRIAALLLFSSLLIHTGCGLGQYCQCDCDPCRMANSEPGGLCETDVAQELPRAWADQPPTRSAQNLPEVPLYENLVR